MYRQYERFFNWMFDDKGGRLRSIALWSFVAINVLTWLVLVLLKGVRSLAAKVIWRRKK